MKEKIIREIVNIWFSECKDKINKNESLEQYYSSFKKKELQQILGNYILIKDDVSILEKVPYNEKNTKEEMIDYLLNNLKEIYKTIFYTMDDNQILQWKKLIKNKGYQKINSLEYSINFLNNLKRFKTAKINYDVKNKTIEFCVPKDLLILVKKLINDPNFNKEREYINKIAFTIKMLLKPYGILTIKKLTEIINKTFFNIDEEEVENILRMITVTDNELNIIEHGEEILVTRINYEDIDEIIAFYESMAEGEYKIFTKDEYLILENDIYHCQFQEYNDLLEYLCFALDLNSEEQENFEEWFILDYLNSYQLDEDIANKNLIINLEKSYPNISFQTKATLKKKISNLAKLYPKYNLKGYSVKEKSQK